MVIWEEGDRFGQVRRSPLRYAVEFDPTLGLNRSRLLPGSGLRRERRLSHVVALGGGTGLPVVLMGLRRHLPPECRITAVVTAADDGGSSGILRKQYGVLPPGDIRNCLLALARVAPEVGRGAGPDRAVKPGRLAAPVGGGTRRSGSFLQCKYPPGKAGRALS